MGKYVGGILFVIILLFLGNFVYTHFSNAPLDKKNNEKIEVVIDSGSGSKQIANNLYEKGLIRSKVGFLFREYFSGAKGNLKAGTYLFSKSESGVEIIRKLGEGDVVPRDTRVTITEGMTLREIAQRLEKEGIASAEEFVVDAKAEKFRSRYEFLKDVPNGNLEGYLFPDTYRFFKNTSTDKIITRMLDRFNEQFTYAAKSTGGLGTHNLHEIVTMASIIEREVITPEDRRLVSGVLWSRIGHGVAMAADATTRYILNNWDKPLTVDDLKIDSPYNTRNHVGLPPGPIGNPGLDTLKAAMQPTESDYFYYLSAKDGKTVFSKTLEEHNKAITKYLR